MPAKPDDRQEIPKEIRERLERVRHILASQSAFEDDSADWAAKAIARFIGTEGLSLDSAFGLVRTAGRPSDAGRRLELARKVKALRDLGATWDRIADEFSAKNESITDIKSLSSLLKEFETELVADELCRRLDKAE